MGLGAVDSNFTLTGAGNVSQATASEQFPGFLVVASTQGTSRYPDALVVWRPAVAPANPTGLPRFNELIVYCPGAATPSAFLEITNSADTRNAENILVLRSPDLAKSYRDNWQIHWSHGQATP